MLIIIDGYNIIKQRLSVTGDISDPQRQLFIDQLNYYSKCKGNEVVVVFDGGEYHRPSKSVIDKVTVIYSGYRSKADDIIKSLVESVPKSTLVVTSDRALCKYISSKGLVCIASRMFDEHLRAILNVRKKSDSVTQIKSKQVPIKRFSDNQANKHNSELDILMEKASATMIDKDAIQDMLDSRNHDDTKLLDSARTKRARKLIKKL